MIQIAPSILSADFSDLAQSVRETEKGGAHMIHVDVMDGHFVPNISFGPAVMKSLEGKTSLPFDVHLMIEDPDDYIEEFVTDNTEYITVHQEVCTHLNRTLEHIKSFGVKCGVSINPGTPLAFLDEALDQADLILVMSVNPGFGGQKFIESTSKKIEALDNIRKSSEKVYRIEVDGGINENNIRTVIEKGADIIVAGSSIFRCDDIKSETEKYVRIAKEYVR